MIGAAQAQRHQFSLDAEAEPARDYYVRAGGLTKKGLTFTFLEPDSKSRRILVVPGDPADEQESQRQHEPCL